jgi:hypothetical protein
LKYLQIIPSFRGIERLMQQQTKQLAREIDKAISTGANEGLLKAFRNVDTDRVGGSARVAGDKWSSTFERQVGRQLKDLADGLPAFEPDADLSHLDRAIADSRAKLTELSKVKFGPDDPAAMQRLSHDLGDVVQQMTQLADQTDDVDKKMKLLGTARHGELLRGMTEEARAQGVVDGRSYGGAFAAGVKERIEHVLHDLPHFDLDANLTPAQRAIAELRAELETLGNKKIGVDIDRDRFAQDLALVTSRLEGLAKDPQTITLKYDLDSAAKSLRQFSDRVTPELNAQMDRSGQAGGEHWAGAYADAVQTRLAGAIRSIPQLPVQVDGSEAERQLAAIRLELQSLQDQRIGVDVDAAAADAKLTELKRRLNELDRDDVTIDVRTNAAAAAAQLALLSAETEHGSLGFREFADSAGIGISRVGYLIALGASIGSLIAPAAATAAIAVAGIGVAAAAAAAGFGVLALALHGVGDAVKKMDAYQQDVNKSARSFGQAQDRVVTATEGVRDAERSLTNARTDGAEAARRGAEQVANAERAEAKARRDAAESVARARENERQAIVDVAQARVDAQDSIATAVRSEQDAERSATAAVRDQRKAREELNQALKDAVRDLRELDTSVKRNALEVDQATTASMKAKQELDKLLANPRATEIEKRMALEAYKDKIIQIEELKNKGNELRQQQLAAAKEGVESTDRVKKARERVANADEQAAAAARRLADAQRNVDKARLDATDRIEKAEQRAADAHAATAKAQRDGAEQVAAAQRAVADAQRSAAQQQQQSQRQIQAGVEAVTKAQRGLASASVAAGVAGGDAFDSMNDALNKLTPAGRRFAQWLYGLKPLFSELQASAQSGLLPGLQEGLQTLINTYFPAFDRFVSKISSGLGNMFRATAVILQDPKWRGLFTFLEGSALPALQQMWVSSLNLARGVANIFRALAPLSAPIGAGLTELTERFARWSDTLQTNSGFQQFLTYSASVGPQVVHLIEELATFMGRLVVAAAPVGQVVLQLVTSTVEWMNSWDLDTLTSVLELAAELGTAIYVLVGVVRLVKFAQEAWNTISLISVAVQKILAAAVLRYNAATAGAVSATGLLNGRLFATEAAGAAGAAGMSAMSAAAGPLGVALAGIGAIWYLNYRKQEKAKEATDQLVDGFKELGKTYKATAEGADGNGAAIADSFKRVTENNQDMQQTVLTLTGLGASLTDIAGAVGGSADAMNKVIDLVDKRIEQLKKENQQHLFDIFQNEKRSDEIQRLYALEDRMKEAADQAGLTSDAMKVLNASTQGLADSTAFLTPQQQALTEANRVLSDQASTTQEKIDALTKAQDTMRQATVNAIEADEQWHASLDALTNSVHAAKSAHDKHATSLAVDTATGRSNRDMLEQLIDSADRMYDADVALNGVTADAVKKGQDHYNQIREVAKQLHLNKDQTNDLIKAYGRIPAKVGTTVTMDQNSFQTVYKNLQRMQFMQSMLRLGKTPAQAEADWADYQRELNRTLFRAEGGPVDGPGTKTSDSVLVRASRGEYVQQAEAVDYYGEPFMAAINQKRIPRQALPGYAAGGKVGGNTWPFKVDVSKTWVPTQSWVQQSTAVPDASGALVSLDPDATTRKIQQFALNQRGKTYLWSAVGPNRYDCSGLVGNLWALATGHSLYHRYMSTGDMGPGKHGMVAGPGKHMTVYLGPGHTAANVGGLHAEAYGGNGTPLAIGRIGTRLSYYNQKLHLPGFAEGGLVNDDELSTTGGRLASFLRRGWPEPPPRETIENLLSAAGRFDSGGMLPPDWSMAYNGTGRPEAVLTADQWQAITALAGTGGAGGGNTYKFEFRDTTLDESRLRAIQDREAVQARTGRAR